MEGRIPGWRGGQWQGEQERERMVEGVARAHVCDRVRLASPYVLEAFRKRCERRLMNLTTFCSTSAT